jgi:hypothetical protein
MSESSLIILNFLSSTVIDGEENFVSWSKKKKKISDVKMKKPEKALFPRSCDESPNFIGSLQNKMSSVGNQGHAPEGKKNSIVWILRYHRSKEMAEKKIPKICQKWAKMSKNAEKIKNPKISSCDKTYLYIKLTLTRSEINIFFIFSPKNFFPEKKIQKICQKFRKFAKKWAKMSKNAEKSRIQKISSRDKTYLYINLTLSRSKINIFFIFSPKNFFPEKKITKICQKFRKFAKNGQK